MTFRLTSKKDFYAGSRHSRVVHDNVIVLGLNIGQHAHTTSCARKHAHVHARARAPARAHAHTHAGIFVYAQPSITQVRRYNNNNIIIKSYTFIAFIIIIAYSTM